MPPKVCECFVPAVVDEAVTGLALVSAQVEHQFRAIGAVVTKNEGDDRGNLDGCTWFAPREDKTIHRLDLKEYAAGGKLLAGLVIGHCVRVVDTDTDIERDGVGADTERTEPLCQFGLLGPSAPHESAWGIEGTGDE